MIYRDLLNRGTTYLQRLRDRQLDTNGILADFYLPGEGEDNVNFFGDQLPDPSMRIHKRFMVIPSYNQYYMLIGIVGQTYEDNLPLEVMCEANAVIPVGSLFELPLKGPNGFMRNVLWRVASVDVRHVDVPYGKVLKAVPARAGVPQKNPDGTVTVTTAPDGSTLVNIPNKSTVVQVPAQSPIPIEDMSDRDR